MQIDDEVSVYMCFFVLVYTKKNICATKKIINLKVKKFFLNLLDVLDKLSPNHVDLGILIRRPLQM